MLQGQHSHFPVLTIHEATVNLEEEWKKATENVTATYNKVKSQYEEWAPLIKYYEACEIESKEERFGRKVKKLQEASLIAEEITDFKELKS